MSKKLSDLKDLARRCNLRSSSVPEGKTERFGSADGKRLCSWQDEFLWEILNSKDEKENLTEPRSEQKQWVTRETASGRHHTCPLHHQPEAEWQWCTPPGHQPPVLVGGKGRLQMWRIPRGYHALVISKTYSRKYTNHINKLFHNYGKPEPMKIVNLS